MTTQPTAVGSTAAREPATREPSVREPSVNALLPDGRPVQNLEDLLRSRAIASPESTAVISDDGRTSFRELDIETNRVANALLRDGVRPGDRVAYIGANAPSFLSVLYGSSKMGSILTAVNNRLAPGEVDYILSNSEPTVVVLGAGDEGLSDVAAAVGSVRTVVTVDGSGNSISWNDWLSGVGDDDPGSSRRPDDTALIFYSSGTTGHPKGIELTGANLGRALATMYHLLDLDTDSVAMCPVPFFHVAGLGLALVTTLGGGALLLETIAGPLELVALMQEYKVTHAVAVPAVISVLTSLPAVREADWSALQFLVYGAAPMPLPLLQDATEVFGCSFLQAYGLTESTGGVTMLTPEDHRATDESTAHRLKSVGQPMFGVPIRIVDPVTLEDVPVGTRGEVVIGGAHVMKRYWRNEAATAATMLDGDWLRTGDGGSFDEDGYLYLHDRLKDMIVSGGENVYPAEVESVLSGHPGIREVAVVGVHSDRWGETPLAVVVRAADSDATEAEIIEWSRERLAHFKCPSAVRFIEELPRNASGKLLKTRLRQDFA
ncbi:long-chain-fatty-acid--CoA ligase [Rhodococcus erythropolis]|uniref:Long-chain-fatty-acid--CoA ligase n=1 Tax=Rhodococcus erythropolis TaxID=1833 RepID=A0A5P3GCU3_RHOER|nr:MULTISPECIES: long-chain-fatty-acid--CoA ligase [Rhodococcus]MCJ0944947.1 long-chain-fatty-acid--CoA ligase [Rhodococcus sp. ARC_M8]QEX12705.1 long-chain-fatty-acid--CoA ligase [Rhodococcus erythropolis]QIP41969.1 long-chain-fatty-acid--CoA ligase [Rhodococcus erythropolis]UKO85140.1 long-chain-fatty-acid--CoA ligase [Rhodococcus erythropolis]ULD42234.1 long-chain-fatty-acid--CoA ligase [Rhodococcus qingshengii]